MKKRVVLITGVCGRLGSVFCEKYHNDYIIVGCGRTKKENSAHHFIQADINTEAEKIVDETLLKFGKIDVLINNAAIYSIKPLIDTSAEQMMHVFQTNVIAPHQMSVLVLQKFWKDRVEKNQEKNRNIINISSISALYTYENQGAYASSKVALNHLTHYQAQEFKQYGIRINGVAPTGFPRIITTVSVVESVREIDQSTETGIIKIID